jgi:hypothetical protein
MGVSGKNLKFRKLKTMLIKYKIGCFGLLIGIFMFGMQSCQKKTPEPDSYLFELKSLEDTGVDFVNDLAIEVDLNIFNYLYYYNGAGLAIADFNRDSLPDILFTANNGRESMYLNKGGLKFEDVSDRVNIDGGEKGLDNRGHCHRTLMVMNCRIFICVRLGVTGSWTIP